MPSIGDVISLSQGLYAPAIFAALLVFVSGAFLNSTDMIKHLVDRIEAFVKNKEDTSHGTARLVAFVFLFFVSPMVFNIIGGLSPVSISFPHSFNTLDDSSSARLAQIWCSFPAIQYPGELRDFVYSVAAEHDINQSVFAPRGWMSVLLTQFHQGVTILLILLLSAFAALFTQKYRRFRPLNFLLSAALAGLMIWQTFAAQRDAHSSAGHGIIISAYSRLLSEGRVQTSAGPCVGEKRAALQRDADPPRVNVNFSLPRIYRVIPVDTASD